MKTALVAKASLLFLYFWFIQATGYAQTKKLIHFWDFNNTVPLTGQGDVGGNGDSLGNSAHPLPVEYTTLPLSGAKISYIRPHTKQGSATRLDSVLDNDINGADYYDYSSSFYPYYTTTDSSAAAAVCSCNGNLSVRARNPSMNSYMYMFVPTNGYMNIQLDYATSVSSSKGAQYNVFSYSTNGGTTWNNLTTAMDTFNISGVRRPDTIMVLNSLTTTKAWYPVYINFTSASAVNNNSGFIIRFYITGSNSTGNTGSDRYDNIAIRGDSICPVIYQPPQNATVCPGNDTMFTTGIEGGLNNSYQWQQNSGSGFVNVSNGGVFSGATTDTLRLTGIPASMSGYLYRCVISCPSCNNDTSTSATLTLKPAPPVLITETSSSVCIGNSVTLTGTGAVSYSWTGGVTNGVAFTPSGTLTYTVTGTGANGCTDTSSIKVTVNPLPTVGATASSDSVCSGNKVTLNGTGAKTYSWTSGVINDTAFVPASTQTYTVTGTDSNGCVNTANIKITMNPIPTIGITASTTAICNGNSVTLSGTGAVSYAWTGGVTNGVSFSPATSATYTVTGTNSHGCTNNDTITITVYSLPAVTATSTPDSVCAGNNVILNGNGASTYSWSSGVTNGVAFVPPGTQTYTVTGTDSHGCVDTASIKVKVNPLPVVTASSSVDSLCAGGSAILNGGGAKTYTWTGGVINTVSFTPATTQTYTVTGTDSNGCVNTASVTVLVNPLPSVSIITTSSAVCIGNSVTLSGSGAAIYSWTGGVTNGNSFTPASTQTYTVTGTDNHGCTNTDSITITVNSLPIVSANTTVDSVCLGQSITLSGAGALTYAWTGGASNGVAFSPAASQTYTVTGTDANGCMDTASVSITVNSLPLITAGGNTAICSGDSTTLTSAGGISYVWNTSATSSSITVAPANTITYTVTGSNGTCSNIATITVNVTQTPVPVGTNEVSVCAGSNVNLDITGGTTYTWTPAIGLTSTSASNPVASPSSTTTYSVILANGVCTAKDSVVVTVNALPVEIPTATPTNIVIGTSTQLNISPQNSGSNYVWQPSGSLSCDNCPDPQASPLVTTTYYVTTTNEFGCSTIDTVTVNVTDDCGKLFVPNIFSPNGDGHNDYLKVLGLCIKTMDFVIYDRWGNKIFESMDQATGWDGTYRGEKMMQGAYAYYLKAILLDGREVDMNGNVALVR